MHASNIWFKKSEMVVVSFLQFISSLFHIYIYIYIIHKICQISAILFYLDWKTWNLALLQILVGVQVRSSKILLCMRISLICSLCSVEIVYSGINFPVFFFHNLLCAAGFLLCSLVEHSWLLVVFLFHWLTIENGKPSTFLEELRDVID